MKRTISGILASTLVLGTMIPAVFADTTTSSFPDVPAGASYASAVSDLVSKGIIQGETNGNFNPTGTMTRGDFAALLARSLGLNVSNPPSTPTFSDVSTADPDYKYIEACVKAGVLHGMGDGTYNPTGQVTREQAATALIYAFGKSSLVNKTAVPTFTDASSIDGWAKPFVALAQQLKYITGDANNDFMGTTALARSDAAVWDEAVVTATGTITNLAITGGTSVAVGGAITLGLTGGTNATFKVADGTGSAVVDDKGNLVGTAAGTVTVTATNSDGRYVIETVNVYGQAAGIKLSTPTNLVANGSSTETITATVVDANGNKVSNFNGTVNVAITQGGNVKLDNAGVGGYALSNVAITNGIATFSAIAGSTVGSETISLNGLTSTNGASIASNVNYPTVAVSSVAATANKLGVTSNIPSISVNNATASNVVSVTTQVQDSTGANFSAPEYVTLTLTGPGSFSATSSVTTLTEYTSAAGSVSVNVYATQGVSGTIAVSASASGLSSGTLSIPTYVTTAPASVSVTSAAGTTTSGTKFTLYTAQLLDANGHLVTSGTGANDPITISDNTSTTGGTLQYYNVANGQPTTIGKPINLANGVATFAVENTAVGTSNPTISVVDTNLNLTGTSAYSDVVGSAAQVGISSTTTNQTVKAGQAVTISAQLKDANGNNVLVAGQNVVFYFNSNSLNATLPNGVSLTGSANGYVAQTNASGIASVTVQVPTTAAQGSFQVNANLQGGSLAAAQGALNTEVTAANFGTALAVGIWNGSSVTAFSWPTSVTAGGTIVPTGLVLTNAIGGEANAADQIKVTTSNPNVISLSAYDSGSTTTNTVTLSSGANIALPTLTAKQAGTATVTFTDVTNPSVPVVSESVAVGTSAVAGGAVATNGAVISSTNELTVTANTPVAVTIYNVDGGGNPVPVTSTEANGQSGAVFSLADTNGGQFRATASGSPISFVTIPVGASSTTVYYVNPNAATISSGLTASTPLTATGVSFIANSAAPVAGTADALIVTLTGAPTFNGVLPISIGGTVASTNGTAASLPTSATFVSGVATVPVTLNSATAQNVTVAVDGFTSASTTITPVASAASTFTVSPSTSTTAVAPATTQLVTATVLDKYGNTVSGATVNWTVAKGTDAGTVGTLSSATSTTGANGQATVTYTEGTGATGTTDVVTGAVTGATSTASTSTIAHN